MKITDFEKQIPCIAKSAFLATNATVVGNVEILENSSIWYGCIICGDVNCIKIGKSTNIQDGTIIHVGSNHKGRTVIGDYVTIGHQCLIHACTLSNYTFVGMGSIIMDGAILEENSMIGAGSLVTEGKTIKSGHLWLGRPAKYIRDLMHVEIAHIKQSADNYCKLAKRYTKIT